jgi:hypothetical protein
MASHNNDDDAMEKGEVGAGRSLSDTLTLSSEPYQMKQSTLNLEDVSQTKYSPSEVPTGTNCNHAGLLVRMLTISREMSCRSISTED